MIKTILLVCSLTLLNGWDAAPPVQSVPVQESSIVDDITYYNISLDESLQRYTYDKCVEYGIESYYNLVLAVMWHESEFNAEAISTTNDYGLMQINICNHKWLSDELEISDFLEPRQNIDAGVYMLSNLLLKYDTVDMALMSYNMGETKAQKLARDGITTSVYVGLVYERSALLQLCIKEQK